MKKLLFVLTAVAALTLSSCGGKTQTPGVVEATAEAPAQADDVAAALESDLNGGDANTFKARVTAIIEKVKELVTQNPQQAQEYFTKAQEFLKANADKISSVVGNNAEINALVSTITDGNAAQFVGSLIGSMGGNVQQELQNAAGQVMDQLPEGVQSAVQDAVGNLLGGAAEQPAAEEPAAEAPAAE